MRRKGSGTGVRPWEGGSTLSPHTHLAVVSPLPENHQSTGPCQGQTKHVAPRKLQALNNHILSRDRLLSQDLILTFPSRTSMARAPLSYCLMGSPGGRRRVSPSHTSEPERGTGCFSGITLVTLHLARLLRVPGWVWN